MLTRIHRRLAARLVQPLLFAAAAGVLATGASAAPREIRFAFGAPILTLDPGISAGSQAQTVRFHMMESLIQLNADTGAIEPLLAESWSVADDKVTWTFRLRPNVRFHDGATLTSADVAASLKRLIDPKSGLPRGNDLRIVKEIREVDPLTVELVTATPFGPFLQTLAQDSSSIISKASIPPVGAKIDWNVVGTGPYKYGSHTAEQSVTLVRNDAYWGRKPAAPAITFLNVPEASTRLAMLETGEADLVVDVPGFEVPRLKASKQVALIQRPNTRLMHIGINVTKAPFTDVRVRQAMNFAIDREAIVEGVLGGLGVPAKSILAPSVFGYAPQATYGFDPAKAKALLAAAGFPNGFATTLWTPQGRYYMDREVTVAVQAQLLAVGIRADVQVVDWSTYLTLLRKPEAENQSALYTLGWETGTGDVQYILDTVFNSKRIPPAGWNTMFYRSPEADALAADISAEVDPDKRKALASQEQAKIMADAPWVPLYGSIQVAAHRSDITGVEYLATDNYRLKNVSFR